MARHYRGHAILTTQYQGTTCYYIRAFGYGALAADLPTLKRWIDQAIAAKEIRS